MPLFQKTILKKYSNALDSSLIDEKWKQFKVHFQNPVIQQNIRNSKEEQYQEGFIADLFVTILGYVKNPAPNFNITTELKNEGNSKKTDAAIIFDQRVAAVIELKGCDTTDLSKVEIQAFGYKNRQANCRYVITSNFEKLRFYIHNAIEHIEFNLFELTREDFETLWLCLAYENLQKNIPESIQKESVSNEDQITKQLYKDYSQFKRDLFNDLVRKNPQFDKLQLFKKTQKLIDRFLFILFAEDRLLLPANFIVKINTEWKQLQELRVQQSLFDRYKLYFEDLNSGNPKQGIFAYNGGLFQPDEALKHLKVSDDLLFLHTNKLSSYDFESEVDVNILGHIFENSLNEIEEITAELEGTELETNKTKRKKDGVFYTPKYITKYIVENTIGTLCTAKKAMLEITDEFYTNAKKRSRKRLENLQKYRDWLLQLKICDPACGSGAFLNQALEFLIAEHQYLDELTAKYHNDPLILSDVENSILENNLYGVDINEESVHIAKLSLWLRTAQRNRKLNNLNQNIKCGNSLIADPEIAGEKAFDWEKEFPEVFDASKSSGKGFDVVIGNPPYVDIKALDPKLSKYLFKAFQTTENRINLYSVFIEKGFSLLKDKGYLSFINPNSILVNSSYTKIRKLLMNHMTTIIKLPDGVFPDAIVETIIFELQKNSFSKTVKAIVYPKSQKITFIDNEEAKKILKSDWKQSNSWNYNIYVSPMQFNLLKKIKKDTIELNEIADFSLGITPYDKYRGHSQELIKSREYHSFFKKDETYKPLISGENIQRYLITNKITEYLKYGDWLGASREEKFFTEPRIVIRQIVSGNPPRIYAGYTEENLYFTQIGFAIIPLEDAIKTKTLLCVINSKLMNFFHKYSFLDLEKNLFQKILIANCKKFPIKNISLSDQKPFTEKAVKMLMLNTELQEMSATFLRMLDRKFGIGQLSKKLQSWHHLNYGEFIVELGKKKVKLSLAEEAEWEVYFLSEKAKAEQLKKEIQATDEAIDNLVYALYGLNSEEIGIVENA